MAAYEVPPKYTEFLQRMLANEARTVGYAGRPESASTAPGSPKVHAREQAELIDLAFAPATLTRRWRRRLIRRRRQWISEGG